MEPEERTEGYAPIRLSHRSYWLQFTIRCQITDTIKIKPFKGGLIHPALIERFDRHPATQRIYILQTRLQLAGVLLACLGGVLIGISFIAANLDPFLGWSMQKHNYIVASAFLVGAVLGGLGILLDHDAFKKFLQMVDAYNKSEGQ